MRQALTGLDGVVAAEVSFEEARARVRYRPDVTNPEAMIAAVEAIGFRARVAEAPDAARSP